MRQNGLRASSFVPVVDADPRVCDQLLDLLRLADVAAYSEPSPGTTGVYRDHHVPSRRLDRLWVDRAETSRAREVLDRALPHLQAELEVAIRDGVPVNAEAVTGDVTHRAGSIQAAGGQAVGAQPGPASTGSSPVGSSPAGSIPTAAVPNSPNVPNVVPTALPGGGDLVPPVGDPPGLSPAATPDERPSSGVDPSERSGDARLSRRPATEPDDEAVELAWAAIVADFDLPAAGPAPWPATEDVTTSRVARLRRSTRPGAALSDRPEQDPDGEHFVPPPPPTLPRLDPMARVGWAAVVAGPIVLVLVVVFGQSLPGWVPLLGVFTLVGGFALLVSRLRPSSDDDSDHHDGAVV